MLVNYFRTLLHEDPISFADHSFKRTVLTNIEKYFKKATDIKRLMIQFEYNSAPD